MFTRSYYPPTRPLKARLWVAFSMHPEVPPCQGPILTFSLSHSPQEGGWLGWGGVVLTCSLSLTTRGGWLGWVGLFLPPLSVTHHKRWAGWVGVGFRCRVTRFWPPPLSLAVLCPLILENSHPSPRVLALRPPESMPLTPCSSSTARWAFGLHVANPCSIPASHIVS